ncbi:MAG: CoA transferase [Armatimonadetes bacterium]|nr:CoA transferase [Armatimonadota bacterium]
MADAPTGPLRGLRVVDLSTIVSGGMATSLLADFGADVVKVEHPQGGDALRQWGPFAGQVSLWWKVASRNKRSVTLNLSHPEGQDLFRALVRHVDVVVENFRPGTLERWGLGYEHLETINPRLILLRVSGFGQTGPYRNRPGFGTVAEAMSGLVAITGFPDGPPVVPPFPMADEVAGTMGALAVLMAIYHRDVAGGGRGQVIDVSLYEPLFRMLIPHVTQYDLLGLVAQRVGNYFPDAAPRNLYQTGDGRWVAISATSQRTFERLAAAIGHADLLDDPRFRDNPSRVANREALDSAIGEWMRARTQEEALRVLEEHGAVAGPVYDINQIVRDPHFAARGNIIDVEDGELGRMRMVGVIPHFSRTRGQVVHAGPPVGAHTAAVYQGWLGLSDGEMARLREAGVI